MSERTASPSSRPEPRAGQIGALVEVVSRVRRARPAPPFRVVVTGGRDYTDTDWIDAVLLTVKATVERVQGTTMQLAHGACPTGVDMLADRWARREDVVTVPYPAEAYGAWPSCGPIRNKAMLDDQQPHLVVAFPGGRGTQHCVAQARERGLRVFQVAP